VSTAAKTKRPKPKQAAQAWWAKAAYSGQDRKAALAALEASGIPLKPVAGSMGLLSAMARGDALIKGAASLSVPRRKGSPKNARYHRLLQWRLVMGYAGFEIFAKACVGRSDRGGLKPDEVATLLSGLVLPKELHLTPPTVTAHSSRWLLKNDSEQAIDALGTFLHLGGWEKDFLNSWFIGKPITSHADACHLAKILRHTTAHGVLSPAKCHGLGFTEALKVLPKTINEIRTAVICRLHDCHHRGKGIATVEQLT